jgi:hypothetical protein
MLSMETSGINYRKTYYFEFPELTKLQDKPNSESLYKLRNELKANTQAVSSNLSDGGHGYLALVLSDTQYALLTDQPSVQPAHPGPLAIPQNTSNAMSTVMKEAHHEGVRIFCKVQGVEKALIQQIIQAVAAPYLSSIRDRTSNSLRGTVYSVATKSLHTSNMSMAVSRHKCLRIMTTSFTTWYTILSCQLILFSMPSRNMSTLQIWLTRL